MRRRIGKREWSVIRACDRRRLHERSVPSVASAEEVEVGALMSAQVPWVREDMDLGAAMALMVQHGLEGVAVRGRKGRLMGVVLRSDVDLVDGPRRVGDVVFPTALAVSPSASVARVAALLAFERLPGVAVVDEAGVVLGSVFAHHLLWWLAQRHDYLR